MFSRRHLLQPGVWSHLLHRRRVNFTFNPGGTLQMTQKRRILILDLRIKQTTMHLFQKHRSQCRKVVSAWSKVTKKRWTWTKDSTFQIVAVCSLNNSTFKISVMRLITHMLVWPLTITALRETWIKLTLTVLLELKMQFSIFPLSTAIRTISSPNKAYNWREMMTQNLESSNFPIS